MVTGWAQLSCHMSHAMEKAKEEGFLSGLLGGASAHLQDPILVCQTYLVKQITMKKNLFKLKVDNNAPAFLFDGVEVK